MSTVKSRRHHRNIHKHYNRFEVVKQVNNKTLYFGSYHTLHEAIIARDYYESRDWVKDEVDNSSVEYFYRVYLNHNKTRYSVNGVHGLYLGSVDTIEEALYLRDLYYNETSKENVPDINTLDLTTNNPYIENGLEYPLPDRLILQAPKVKLKGVIRKRDNHYRLEYQGKYYATCITYEQAYFYHREFNKRGWDKKNIPGIAEDYPAYYTWLNRFYIHITKDPVTKNNYRLVISKKNSKDNEATIIHFNKLEDALYERDFLVANDWDYDLLVETIDDANNPYYSMELPPFPERRVPHMSVEYNHDEELKQLKDYINDNPLATREEAGEFLGVTSVTLTNWLKRYGINYTIFKELILNGEDPLEYFSFEDTVYTPDLSPVKPSHFRNYVQKNKQSKKYPYRIIKDGEYYGSYPDKKIANKISNGLQRIGFSKENVKLLREKYDCWSINHRDFIYPTKSGKFNVRRKDGNRNITYGTFNTYLEAFIIRGLLYFHGWGEHNKERVKCEGEYFFRVLMGLDAGMFRVNVGDVLCIF